MTKQINSQLQYVPKDFFLSEQTPPEDGGPNGTHLPNTWRLNAYNRRRRREPFRITVPTSLLIVAESFERNVAITHGVTIHEHTIIKDDSLLERFSTIFVRERLFVQNYVTFILNSNNTTEGPEETRLNFAGFFLHFRSQYCDRGARHCDVQ